MSIQRFVVVLKTQKGYSVANLVLFLLIVGIFIAILIPRIGFLKYHLYTYVDANTANGIAGAVYALQGKNMDTGITIEDVENDNAFIFNAKPFTPGSERFEILWKGKDFYIIAIDKEGKQVGPVLFPN